MGAAGRAEWDRDRVTKTIRGDGIIGVIRTPTETAGRQLSEALVRGGLRLIEVTLTTPGALEIIRDLSGQDACCVGAGTVMDAAQADRVVQAGGRFVIAPHTDPDTVSFCKEKSVVVIPGTLTPSEVVRAWALRPDFVKVFPIAAMGGARYLRLFRGPLPDVPIIPTGGVKRKDLPGLFEAGAAAVGVSDCLATAEDVREGRWEEITQRARDLLGAIREIRGGSPPSPAAPGAG